MVHSTSNAENTSDTTKSKRTGVYKNFISGGISAAFAKTAVNPIERIEILKQVDNIDYKGLDIFKSMNKLYHTEGIRGFFKGNSAALVRIFPFSAVEFYSFEFFKNIFIRGNEKIQNKVLYTFLCGGLTGLSAITLTFPLDVARTRLSINTINSPVKDVGIFGCLFKLYKSEGFRGLYKGYSIVFIVIIFLICRDQFLL
jgi:hypothetical protein